MSRSPASAGRSGPATVCHKMPQFDVAPPGASDSDLFAGAAAITDREPQDGEAGFRPPSSEWRRPRLDRVLRSIAPAIPSARSFTGPCLHASAVEIGGAAVALVGESGVGKSTLAARLGSEPSLGWLRAADDVLPVARTGQLPVIRPRFPQLKLPASEQWGCARPDVVPLAAIYVLALGRPNDALKMKRLSTREGALVALRHTVAGSLFGPELKASHLDFCLALASRLPVREMVVPRGPGLPPGLIERIRTDRRHALQNIG